MQPAVFKWPNNWDLGFTSPVRHNHWCGHTKDSSRRATNVLPGPPACTSCNQTLTWTTSALQGHFSFHTGTAAGLFQPYSSASAACKHLMSSQRTSFIHFMVPRMQRYLPNFLRNINIKGWLSQPKSCKLNKVLLTFHDKVINNTKKKNEMIPDYKLL